MHSDIVKLLVLLQYTTGLILQHLAPIETVAVKPSLTQILLKKAL